MANNKRIIKAATAAADAANTAGKAAANTAQTAAQTPAVNPLEQLFGKNYPKPATREEFLNAYEDVGGMNELYEATDSGSGKLKLAMREAVQAGENHPNGVAGAIADALYPAAPAAGLTPDGKKALLNYFGSKAPGIQGKNPVPAAPKTEVAGTTVDDVAADMKARKEAGKGGAKRGREAAKAAKAQLDADDADKAERAAQRLAVMDAADKAKAEAAAAAAQGPPKLAAKAKAEKVTPEKAPKKTNIKGKVEAAPEVPSNNIDNSIAVESTTELAPTPTPKAPKRKSKAPVSIVYDNATGTDKLIPEDANLSSGALMPLEQDAFNEAALADATGTTPPEGAVDADSNLVDLDLAAQTIENMGNGIAPQVDANAPDFSNVAQSQTGEPDFSNFNPNPHDMEKLSEFQRIAMGQPDPADMQAAARQRRMSQDYQPEEVVGDQPSPIGGLLDEQSGVDTSVVTPPKNMIDRIKTASKYGIGVGAAVGAEEFVRQNFMGGGEGNGSTGMQNAPLDQALQLYLDRRRSQQMPQGMQQPMPQPIPMQQGMPQ